MNWKLRSLDWPTNVAVPDNRTLDEAHKEIFQGLRQQFALVRDKPEDYGLKRGIQKNAILVVDKHAVDSVLSRSGLVDEMWVWALDPDHAADGPEGTARDGYKGHFRVRLQQLPHNLFNLRHFYEREYPMRELWKAAQQSRDKLFVSIEPDEVGL